MSWLGLEGKVAIVTGGACGIGRAVSKGLAEVGAKIVIADIDEKGAGNLVDDLKKQFSGEYIATKTDVTDKTSVDAMVAAALNAFGDIDILTTAVIPAAGIALGIFVRQHRALRFQNGPGHDVLRGDQLDLVLLPAKLVID